jgi:hypothetical protein
MEVKIFQSNEKMKILNIQNKFIFLKNKII